MGLRKAAHKRHILEVMNILTPSSYGKSISQTNQLNPSSDILNSFMLL